VYRTGCSVLLSAFLLACRPCWKWKHNPLIHSEWLCDTQPTSHVTMVESSLFVLYLRQYTDPLVTLVYHIESEVKGNPISLLKAIQQHALDCQGHRHGMSIILDAIKTTVNLKQRDNESLQDYTCRFKTARDALVSHIGGPIILSKHTQAMGEFDEDDEDKIERCEERAFQQLMAHTCLENSDSSKYGTLINGLKMQQSLGSDQCPTTVTGADDILSSHKSDSPHKAQKKKAGMVEEESPALSFSQSEGKCCCCGKAGHMSPACRHKDRPRAEWHTHKVRSAGQQHLSTKQPPSEVAADQRSTAPSPSVSNAAGSASQASQPGWTGAHVASCQATGMRDWTLLDNESTTSVSCDRKYVEDIRPRTKELSLSTNGGGSRTTLTATVPGLHKPVWSDDRAVTDIFASHEMGQKCRVTYDSECEQASYVHTPQKTIKSKRAPNGLHCCKPPTPFRRVDKGAALVETVNENIRIRTRKPILSVWPSHGSARDYAVLRNNSGSPHGLLK